MPSDLEKRERKYSRAATDVEPHVLAQLISFFPEGWSDTSCSYSRRANPDEPVSTPWSSEYRLGQPFEELTLGDWYSTEPCVRSEADTYDPPPAVRLRRWRSELPTTLLVRRLRRLQPGWAGAGSIAPKPTAITDLEYVLQAFTGDEKLPEIEIDEENGSLSAIWTDRANDFEAGSAFLRQWSSAGLCREHSWRGESAWRANARNSFEVARKLSETALRALLVG